MAAGLRSVLRDTHDEYFRPGAGSNAAAQLWSAGVLFLSVGLLLGILGGGTYHHGLALAGAVALLMSAALVLAVLLGTLSGRGDQIWQRPDPAGVMRWTRPILRIGHRIGFVIVWTANVPIMLLTLLDNGGDAPVGNPRFSMCALAILGIMGTGVASLALSPAVVGLLLLGWIAVIAIAFLRGVYGVIAGMIGARRAR